MVSTYLYLFIISVTPAFSTDGKHTDFQTFFTDTTPGLHRETSVMIAPRKGIDFHQGFAICFRAKFNIWTVSTPLKTSVVEISFGKLLDSVIYVLINGVWYLHPWPKGVGQSPYVWYDICLSYKTSM